MYIWGVGVTVLKNSVIYILIFTILISGCISQGQLVGTYFSPPAKKIPFGEHKLELKEDSTFTHDFYWDLIHIRGDGTYRLKKNGLIVLCYKDSSTMNEMPYKRKPTPQNTFQIAFETNDVVIDIGKVNLKYLIYKRGKLYGSKDGRHKYGKSFIRAPK